MLAEGFAEAGIDLDDAASPAGGEFLHTAEGGFEEVKIGLHESGRELGGTGVDDLPGEVGFYVRFGSAGDEIADAFEEVGGTGIEGREGDFDSREVGVPGEGGSKFGEAGAGEGVVALQGVAEGDAVGRDGGEGGFEVQDRFGFGGGAGRVVAEKFEHVPDMGDEFRANFDGFRVGFQVVIAVREGKAGLGEGGDGPVGIFGVLKGA